MATINYQFSDGHYEEIEVTEDFKREYELLERQDLGGIGKSNSKNIVRALGVNMIYLWIPVFFEQVLLLDLLFFMNSRSVYDRKINS